MIRKILSLPEPERTKELEALSETLAIDVYSSKDFPVYYRNKIEKVKKGKNTFSKNFAIYLLRKYAELSETPLNGSQTPVDEPHSPYFEKLVEIKGIGEKSAEEIVKVFPTPAELIEAAKSDRLPDQLTRFKDTFLEVFK